MCYKTTDNCQDDDDDTSYKVTTSDGMKECCQSGSTGSVIVYYKGMAECIKCADLSKQKSMEQ